MSSRRPPPPKPPDNVGISTGIKSGGFGRNKPIRPSPTLPNPNESLGGGIPLWLGIVFILLAAAPLVWLITTGGSWP